MIIAPIIIVRQYPEVLSINEAAELTGISATEIRKWLHSYRKPPHIKSGKKFLLLRDELVEYIKEMAITR